MIEVLLNRGRIRFLQHWKQSVGEVSVSMATCFLTVNFMMRNREERKNYRLEREGGMLTSTQTTAGTAAFCRSSGPAGQTCVLLRPASPQLFQIFFPLLLETTNRLTKQINVRRSDDKLDQMLDTVIKTRHDTVNVALMNMNMETSR